MGLLGFNLSTMTGGLYFGPPAWRVQAWPAIPDQPADNSVPDSRHPADRPSLRALVDTVCPKATSPWMEGLADALNILQNGPCNRLVLNLLSDRPESQLNAGLTLFAMDQLSAGLALLAACLKPDQVVVALGRIDKAMNQVWRREAARRSYRICSLLDRYPQAHPLLLLRAICSQHFYVGESPVRNGIICVDAVTCWALGYWLSYGVAPRVRPVELFSDGAEPGIVHAGLGENIGKLLDGAAINWKGRQCVRNGMLTGEQTDPGAALVDWQTCSLSVRDLPAIEPEMDCIRCGWCVSVCPVALNPLAIIGQVRLDYPPPRTGNEAAACIQCGLCSYVCPSRLPLSSGIRLLAAQQREDSSGDRRIPGDSGHE